MLPTFVIGLREGLEASLIVGIVAAFLGKRGRADLIRWVWIGISSALALCIAAGVALEIVSRNLPQRQQEGLETVIGVAAVAMVTYMVVWMRRHSRDLKGQLEGAAGAALAQGSGWALVAMAFLAVLREGLETVVFLLAAFNESSSGVLAGIGALLGILVAAALGWGIYRGGVRLNLSKFFRATGAVLVLVAAGLVVSALHTAHEAGWLQAGQQSTVNLTTLIRPGSVQESLLTGVLGIQPRPVLIELIGWLVYLVPMLLYVTWPPGKRIPAAALVRPALVVGAVAGVAAVVLAVTMPAAPSSGRVVTSSSGLSASVVSRSDTGAVLRASLPTTGSGALTFAPPQQVTATLSGTTERDGLTLDTYTATQQQHGVTGTMDDDQLAALGGGRLPLGIKAGSGPVATTRADTDTETFTVARDDERVVDVREQRASVVTARFPSGALPISTEPVVAQLDPDAAADAHQAAVTDAATQDRRDLFGRSAVVLGVIAIGLLTAGAGMVLARRGGGSRAPTGAELTPAR